MSGHVLVGPLQPVIATHTSNHLIKLFGGCIGFAVHAFNMYMPLDLSVHAFIRMFLYS